MCPELRVACENGLRSSGGKWVVNQQWMDISNVLKYQSPTPKCYIFLSLKTEVCFHLEGISQWWNQSSCFRIDRTLFRTYLVPLSKSSQLLPSLPVSLLVPGTISPHSLYFTTLSLSAGANLSFMPKLPFEVCPLFRASVEVFRLITQSLAEFLDHPRSVEYSCFMWPVIYSLN